MTERARLSAPFLDMLGKQLQSIGGGLLWPAKSSACLYPMGRGGSLSPLPQEPGLKQRGWNWVQIQEASSLPTQCLHHPHVTCPGQATIAPSQEKAPGEESLQSRLRQPQGPRRSDLKALRESLGVKGGRGRDRSPLSFQKPP